MGALLGGVGNGGSAAGTGVGGREDDGRRGRAYRGDVGSSRSRDAGAGAGRSRQKSWRRDDGGRGSGVL